MKRSLFFCSIVIGLVFPTFAFAQSTEHIRSYDVVASINRGDDLLVIEQISYDFADGQKHGIFRYIPETMVVMNRKINLGLHWLGVLRDGKQDPTSTQSTNGNTVIKVGDPSQTISGKHDYRLSYSVAHSIVAEPMGQRLTWNITGDHWPVDIASSTFVLDAPIAPVSVTCYTGVHGSTEHACTAEVSGTKVLSRITRSLNAGEGWTIEATYPAKTFIAAATERPSAWPWLTPGLIFTILFSLAWIVVWYIFGRDESGRGTIITEFDPPEGWKPYEVNMLEYTGGNHRGLAATVLDLARRGVIKLTLLNEGKDYRIERLRDKERELDAYEAKTIELLFVTGDEFSPLTGRVERSSMYQGMQNLLDKTLVKKGLYQSSVTTSRALSILIVAITWFISYYLVNEYFYDPLLNISIIGLIIGGICAYVMPKRLHAGTIVYEQIEGFKTYINVAEKDRMAFAEAPAKTPERFSKLLPFAVALGVERAWGSLFKDIAMPADQLGASSSMMYATQMTMFTHQLSSDMRSSIVSPSGGSGGGGFSGGGGGGGGGGSW